MPQPTDPRIAELETLVYDATNALAARDARIAELEAALSEKSQALKAANQAKREFELHAAAIIDAAGGTVDVTAETVKKLNPDTKVERHDRDGGHRYTAALKKYTPKSGPSDARR